MKLKVNYYPDELKLKVVQEYLNTHQSQREILKKYNIAGRCCITNWMRKFGFKEPSREQIELQRTMSKEINKTPAERALEVEISALKEELKHEKLRTEALSTMIDIAEKELKISIRKKSGTKQ
jgi:transposase